MTTEGIAGGPNRFLAPTAAAALRGVFGKTLERSRDVGTAPPTTASAADTATPLLSSADLDGKGASS